MRRDRGAARDTAAARWQAGRWFSGAAADRSAQQPGRGRHGLVARWQPPVRGTAERDAAGQRAGQCGRTHQHPRAGL
ncbi:hypothetical protein G6F50_016378 [Rhizopus delemar]|uniref:Uncharacterized protein n=1 Tax=Rhizopus delemar TaxID=936053 RepID=A0A9P6XTU5_9FUNG|nr:hypothetical protein G6F50_016378 [Rhizopus delemar]